MTTTATPVRFAQRPDRNLVLGLSATRAITLAACVLAVAAVTVAVGMTVSLVVAGLGSAGRVGVGRSVWFVAQGMTGPLSGAFRLTCPFQVVRPAPALPISVT